MAELVVIGYSTEAEAQEVCDVVCALERDLVVQTAGSAIVVADASGQHRVVPGNSTQSSSTGGRLWSMVMDDFGQQASSVLPPGSAAVMLLFARQTPDRMIEALAPYGGRVVKAPLSLATEQQLREMLAQGRSTATT